MTKVCALVESQRIQGLRTKAANPQTSKIAYGEYNMMEFKLIRG